MDERAIGLALDNEFFRNAGELLQRDIGAAVGSAGCQLDALRLTGRIAALEADISNFGY